MNSGDGHDCSDEFLPIHLQTSAQVLLIHLLSVNVSLYGMDPFFCAGFPPPIASRCEGQRQRETIGPASWRKKKPFGAVRPMALSRKERLIAPGLRGGRGQ